MKYLKGRDNYLNELKVNSGLVPYTKNDSIIKLNEEALTNSTKWGDSLLGRLINSAIRKAKIGVGLLRINNVIKSLYKLFDDMVADGVIKEMPVASRIKIYKFYLIKFIEEVYKGSNSINYKNVYYFSYCNKINMNINQMIEDSYEVSDIKWMPINECLEKIRPYDETKKSIIHSVYFFLVNLITNN